MKINGRHVKFAACDFQIAILIGQSVTNAMWGQKQRPSSIACLRLVHFHLLHYNSSFEQNPIQTLKHYGFEHRHTKHCDSTSILTYRATETRSTRAESAKQEQSCLHHCPRGLSKRRRDYRTSRCLVSRQSHMTRTQDISTSGWTDRTAAAMKVSIP